MAPEDSGKQFANVPVSGYDTYPYPLRAEYGGSIREPMSAADIQAIDARQKAISGQIADLQKEMEELTIAKRVLLRLETPVDKIVRELVVEPGRAGKPRPSGTPTNFEMMDHVLADAERNGKDGLLVGEIVDAIRARYWPGLVSEQITPSIYQFASQGRFKKSANGKFRRVKKIEDSTEKSAESS
jgi:hypothetical protein